MIGNEVSKAKETVNSQCTPREAFNAAGLATEIHRPIRVAPTNTNELFIKEGSFQEATAMPLRSMLCGLSNNQTVTHNKESNIPNVCFLFSDSFQSNFRPRSEAVGIDDNSREEPRMLCEDCNPATTKNTPNNKIRPETKQRIRKLKLGTWLLVTSLKDTASREIAPTAKATITV